MSGKNIFGGTYVHTAADLDYINKRNALIPRAEKITNLKVQDAKLKGLIPRQGYEFSKAMTILAAEKGLTSQETITLFNMTDKELFGPHYIPPEKREKSLLNRTRTR